MSVIIRYFKNNWPRFLASVLLAVVALLIYVGVNGKWGDAYSYSQALAIGGAIDVFVGGLALINNLGGFYMASYYFRRRKLEGEGRKEDLYEYQERKKEEHSKQRFSFLAYVFIGAIAIVASFIMLAVIRS